jgi:hypothetical protein
LAAALAENALESERKERTGSFEHTPQHLYDVDGPAMVAGGGDWGDYDCVHTRDRDRSTAAR